MLIGRHSRFDKSVIDYGKMDAHYFKVKGHSYALTYLLPGQVQPSIRINWERNTSEKALFLSDTPVKTP